MHTAATATTTMTTVDIGAAAGIVVALVAICAATIRLVAAVRSRQGEHEQCAALMHAATESYGGIIAALRAENERLAAAQRPPPWWQGADPPTEKMNPPA